MICRIIFVFSLVLSVAFSQSCTTPLGEYSDCVSLYDCQPLINAFNQRPLPNHVVTFLRQSQCGFDGYTPRVCCGPLPTNRVPPPTRRPPPTPAPSYSGVDEDSYYEDSSPSPRGECGIDTNGDRIFGGQFTDLDEFPWMALLGYRKPDGRITYQCGGVLINRRYVMTAAHCVTGAIEREVGRLVTVRLGEYDTQSDVDCNGEGDCADRPQDIAVDQAIPHPGYSDRNKNKKDDIAIVRLSRRATITYYVNPICLPGAGSRLSSGNDVYVAGWGKTLSGSSSPVKLKVVLPIFDKNTCVNKYRELGANLIDKQICAGGTLAKDACRGDSGGPLMIKSNSAWVSVGIVSFGYGCGRDGWPGVYTSVPSYLDWIESVLSSTNV